MAILLWRWSSNAVIHLNKNRFLVLQALKVNSSASVNDQGPRTQFRFFVVLISEPQDYKVYVDRDILFFTVQTTNIAPSDFHFHEDCDAILVRLFYQIAPSATATSVFTDNDTIHFHNMQSTATVMDFVIVCSQKLRKP